LKRFFRVSKGKLTNIQLHSASARPSGSVSTGRICKSAKRDIRKFMEPYIKGFGKEHTAANVIQELLHRFEIYSQSIPSGLKVVPT